MTQRNNNGLRALWFYTVYLSPAQKVVTCIEVKDTQWTDRHTDTTRQYPFSQNNEAFVESSEGKSKKVAFTKTQSQQNNWKEIGVVKHGLGLCNGMSSFLVPHRRRQGQVSRVVEGVSSSALDLPFTSVKKRQAPAKRKLHTPTFGSYNSHFKGHEACAVDAMVPAGVV